MTTFKSFLPRMICKISSMHSGAFSRHFDMKVSSMSRKFSISARHSGFMTCAERPALVLPGADAFRLPLCFAFVMFFSFFRLRAHRPQAPHILHYLLFWCQGTGGQNRNYKTGGETRFRASAGRARRLPPWRNGRKSVFKGKLPGPIVPSDMRSPAFYQRWPGEPRPFTPLEWCARTRG